MSLRWSGWSWSGLPWSRRPWSEAPWSTAVACGLMAACATKPAPRLPEEDALPPEPPPAQQQTTEGPIQLEGTWETHTPESVEPEEVLAFKRDGSFVHVKNNHSCPPFGATRTEGTWKRLSDTSVEMVALRERRTTEDACSLLQGVIAKREPKVLALGRCTPAQQPSAKHCVVLGDHPLERVGEVDAAARLSTTAPLEQGIGLWRGIYRTEGQSEAFVQASVEVVRCLGNECKAKLLIETAACQSSVPTRAVFFEPDGVRLMRDESAGADGRCLPRRTAEELGRLEFLPDGGGATSLKLVLTGACPKANCDPVPVGVAPVPALVP